MFSAPTTDFWEFEIVALNWIVVRPMQAMPQKAKNKQTMNTLFPVIYWSSFSQNEDITNMKLDPNLQCQIPVLYSISSYTWFSEPYLWGLLNVCYTMDGWSSNNDSYHFGVGCTSIMLEKRWSTLQCAMHADFNIIPWGTTYENIICFDCDAPHTTITMSRAHAKSQICLHFLQIKYVIRGHLLGKYQYDITTRQSLILLFGSPHSSLIW